VWTSLILICSDARKTRDRIGLWHVMRFLHSWIWVDRNLVTSALCKHYFLTRLYTVKHTTLTNMRDAFVIAGPDRPIRSRIPRPISDIETKMLLRKMLWPRGLGHSRSLNTTAFDRPHIRVSVDLALISGRFWVTVQFLCKKKHNFATSTLLCLRPIGRRH